MCEVWIGYQIVPPRYIDLRYVFTFSLKNILQSFLLKYLDQNDINQN